MAKFLTDSLHILEPASRFAAKRLLPKYVGFGCRVRVCPYSHKFCKDCNLRFTLHK